MSRVSQMTQSDLVRAFDSYCYEETRTVRRGGLRRAPADHSLQGEAHPLRYDERGLPIREDLNPGVERMRRRLTGHLVST